MIFTLIFFCSVQFHSIQYNENRTLLVHNSLPLIISTKIMCNEAQNEIDCNGIFVYNLINYFYSTMHC